MTYIIFGLTVILWALILAPNPIGDTWLIIIAILSAAESIRSGCKK